MGMKIPDIAKRFDRLLEINESLIDYTFHIDREQGIFIHPVNKDTKKAMEQISTEQYKPIFDDMNKVREEIEYGQGYNLRRDQILHINFLILNPTKI